MSEAPFTKEELQYIHDRMDVWSDYGPDPSETILRLLATITATRAQTFAEVENEVRRRMHGGIWLGEDQMLILVKEISGSSPSRSR